MLKYVVRNSDTTITGGRVIFDNPYFKCHPEGEG